MRVRLRPAYAPERLREIYRKPYDHTQWHDHKERVKATVELARRHAPCKVVADLSCGDGAIVKGLAPQRAYTGDLTARGWDFQGPIEQTLAQLAQFSHVDTFILTETLEHLDDPDLVLRSIRLLTDWLVLSTPIGEADGTNPEHYWGWDAAGVLEMMMEAGFTAEAHLQVLEFPALRVAYQLWVCR